MRKNLLPVAAAAAVVAAGVAVAATAAVGAAGVAVAAAAAVGAAGVAVAATATVGTAAVLTGVALVLVVFKRCRLLDQRSQLEAMGMVAAAAVCLGVDIVDVFAIAHIDSRLGRAAELMEVAVRKVGAESDLMHVVVAIFDRFAGNGGNAVIVTLAAADVGFGDTDDLVDVSLFVTAVTSVGSHIF